MTTAEGEQPHPGSPEGWLLPESRAATGTDRPAAAAAGPEQWSLARDEPAPAAPLPAAAAWRPGPEAAAEPVAIGRRGRQRWLPAVVSLLVILLIAGGSIELLTRRGHHGRSAATSSLGSSVASSPTRFPLATARP
ncbi:MAG: hypothetical protein QOF12_229 [Solirubrobacteraceae bacterium]|nr:hypothetical protein [Solirubrobacteraceae bacterium]